MPQTEHVRISEVSTNGLHKSWSRAGMWIVVVLVLFAGAYYFFSHSANGSIEQRGVIQCAGVSVPMPESWTDLLSVPRDKLDSSGCLANAVGCACFKLDPSKTGKGVAFTVSVSRYPAGFTLNDLRSAAMGRVTNVDTSVFRGNPAIQFVDSARMGTLAFTKDGTLYVFTFGALGETFTRMWPDILQALQNANF